MNLYALTPLEIRDLMSQTEDPRILRGLTRLEAATTADDDEERTEAIGDLADYLIEELGY